MNLIHINVKNTPNYNRITPTKALLKESPRLFSVLFFFKKLFEISKYLVRKMYKSARHIFLVAYKNKNLLTRFCKHLQRAREWRCASLPKNFNGEKHRAPSTCRFKKDLVKRNLRIPRVFVVGEPGLSF